MTQLPECTPTLAGRGKSLFRRGKIVAVDQLVKLNCELSWRELRDIGDAVVSKDTTGKPSEISEYLALPICKTLHGRTIISLATWTYMENFNKLKITKEADGFFSRQVSLRRVGASLRLSGLGERQTSPEAKNDF